MKYKFYKGNVQGPRAPASAWRCARRSSPATRVQLDIGNAEGRRLHRHHPPAHSGQSNKSSKNPRPCNRAGFATMRDASFNQLGETMHKCQMKHNQSLRHQAFQHHDRRPGPHRGYHDAAARRSRPSWCASRSGELEVQVEEPDAHQGQATPSWACPVSAGIVSFCSAPWSYGVKALMLLGGVLPRGRGGVRKSPPSSRPGWKTRLGSEKALTICDQPGGGHAGRPGLLPWPCSSCCPPWPPGPCA